MFFPFLWPSPSACCHGWYSASRHCHLPLTLLEGFQPRPRGRALSRTLSFWDSILTSGAIHLHLKLNGIPLIITLGSKAVSHMWKECCNPSPSFCLGSILSLASPDRVWPSFTFVNCLWARRRLRVLVSPVFQPGLRWDTSLCDFVLSFLQGDGAEMLGSEWGCKCLLPHETWCVCECVCRTACEWMCVLC